ncbi:group II intron reverse transcriptase/maturase [Streptomyces sp. SAS_269]|uniref:group II intron reverse transcriptase/maturase n=1 Tax=Streptomyces sp. SAS_269 TaxID=3412749 RepID=UPI00403CD4A5
MRHEAHGPSPFSQRHHRAIRAEGIGPAAVHAIHAKRKTLSAWGTTPRQRFQYYLLAQDVSRLSHLRWVLETSMLKTLASKHRTSATRMARKYKAAVATPDGPRTCFEVRVSRGDDKKPLVARFGLCHLQRAVTAAGRGNHRVGQRIRSHPTTTRPSSWPSVSCTSRCRPEAEDDGRRTCRALWRCTGRHVWWRWADRPEDPLETCPVAELLR